QAAGETVRGHGADRPPYPVGAPAPVLAPVLMSDADDTVSFDELPAVLPVFPLPGALLLPRGKLPLNIFEPRYLAMIRDAMANSQMIGMIQPRGIAEETADPIPDD